MTCLVDRMLSEAWMRLHTSILGSFFVNTLALSMPIFKKKSLRMILDKMPKLFIEVTLLFKTENDKVVIFLQPNVFSPLFPVPDEDF